MAARGSWDNVLGRFSALVASLMAALTQRDRALAGYRAARETLAATDDQLADLRKQDRFAQDMLQADVAATRLQSSAAELARLETLIKVQEVLGDLQDAVQGGFGFSDLSREHVCQLT